SRPVRAPGETIVVPSRFVDRTILEAFRRREPEAVEALYDEYGRLVYAIAYRMLGRHELAEDAVQQTFVRAWESADRLDPARDPGGWIATIAKRVAIDSYRRESWRQTGAGADVASDEGAVITLPPEMDTVDAVWHVRRAIDELPEDEAVIVRMQHLDGLSQ